MKSSLACETSTNANRHNASGALAFCKLQAFMRKQHWATLHRIQDGHRQLERIIIGHQAATTPMWKCANPNRRRRRGGRTLHLVRLARSAERWCGEMQITKRRRETPLPGSKGQPCERKVHQNDQMLHRKNTAVNPLCMCILRLQ